METYYNNTEYNFEIAFIDENGNFVPGLAVNCEILKCTDNSSEASGVMSESSGVYYFKHTFPTNGQYRVKYLAPSGYENGFKIISVIDDISITTASIIAPELSQITDVHSIMGLNVSNPMTVNSTSRKAGTINQNISQNGDDVTVTRV